MKPIKTETKTDTRSVNYFPVTCTLSI